MYPPKKERLYVADLIPEPPLSYPSYYLLSSKLIRDELLHHAIIMLHSYDFEGYSHPKTPTDIFTMFKGGMYPFYKERYIVGYFGGKMMYLESAGWRSMPCSEEVFEMENWLIC